VIHVNASWLALGDASCAGGQEDQAVDQVVFIECLVLDNFQHLFIIILYYYSLIFTRK
jgi:hypothetical protein